jgi:hypothetical protein
MKKVKYADIKTAKNVDEFRKNLKKYFITSDNFSKLFVRGDAPYVNIDEIECLSDLYKMNTHYIIPTISVDVKKISTDETILNMFSRDFSSVLNDENRFPVYEMENAEDIGEYVYNINPYFYSIDNQILRCFYIKTLGNYSGYTNNNKWC